MNLKQIFKIFLCGFLLVSLPIQAAQSEAMPVKPYRFHFKKLPQHIWHDVKSTLWGYNGILFAVGLGASAAFYPLDQDVSRKFVGHPVFGRKADRTIGKVVSPYTIAGASLLTFLISNTTSNSRLTLAMESQCESLFLTLTTVVAGKYAFHRQRPSGGQHSMPSGHTAPVFSTAAVLTSFYGLPAAIPAYAVAAVVSFSRLDGHVHFLTDVLVGAVIGSAFGYGTSMAHKKDHHDYLILPQINSNEAGLVFNKTF